MQKSVDRFMLSLVESAAKLLCQTAKTCQDLEKSLFFLCFLQSFLCLVISPVVFLSLYRSQKVIRPAEAYIWLFVAQSLLLTPPS